LRLVSPAPAAPEADQSEQSPPPLKLVDV